MALTDKTCSTDVALNTDLYELTMAQGFFESGLKDTQASFNVFFRENPFKGGYAICCGTGQIQDMIQNFIYDDDSIKYLSSLKAPGGGAMFKSKFLKWLKDFKMDVDVYAVQEGDVVFPREPIVRVEGSVIACQLLETALLNLVNFQTLVATKTARVVQAAEGHMVSEFGLRRAQGPDGGLSVARASYIGGASSTSNVLAGKVYNIPVFGTHAHSWVMAFPTELEAFRAFAASSPKNCTLLLDTYDVSEAIENAIIVAHEMEERGERLSAVRIDSGDLAKLSKEARERFDAAGLPYVKISASNDLDEYTIQSLFSQGAPIDSFGVGTKMATCDPQPSLGGVYKLSAWKSATSSTWTPVMKLSEMPYKRTIPGRQHILRFKNSSGVIQGDIIVDDAYADKSKKISKCVDVLDSYTKYNFSNFEFFELLHKIVEGGKVIKKSEGIEAAKERTKTSLMHLDAATKRFLNPQIYPVGIDLGLFKVRADLAKG